MRRMLVRKIAPHFQNNALLVVISKKSITSDSFHMIYLKWRNFVMQQNRVQENFIKLWYFFVQHINDLAIIFTELLDIWMWTHRVPIKKWLLFGSMSCCSLPGILPKLKSKRSVVKYHRLLIKSILFKTSRKNGKRIFKSFPVKFAKILRTPFFTKLLRWLLLYFPRFCSQDKE